MGMHTEMQATQASKQSNNQTTKTKIQTPKLELGS